MIELTQEDIIRFDIKLEQGYMLYWTVSDRRIVKVNNNVETLLSPLSDLLEARIFNEEMEYHIKLIGQSYKVIKRSNNHTKASIIEYQVLDDVLSKQAKSVIESSKDAQPVVKLSKEVRFDEDLGQAHITYTRLLKVLPQLPEQ